jgi:hypothetical protein
MREHPFTHVLAVDQATSSGHALHDLRRVCLHGVATNTDERQAALRACKSVRGFSWDTTLVVFEDHKDVPNKGNGTPISLGASLGCWLELLNILKHPYELRMLVTPAEWRTILGTRCNIQRDAWKAQARLYASALLSMPIRNDDEAEAICMSCWGAFDGRRVWSLLPDNDYDAARSVPRRASDVRRSA